MGTSSSSRGPGSNVPLVPPGVPPLPPPLLPPAAPVPPNVEPQELELKQAPIPSAPPFLVAQLAPPRRFMAARTSLGRFAKSASSNELRRGLGHYTKTGLGGSRAATQRMGRTVSTAGGLYGVLQDLRAGTASPVELGINRDDLVGRPAREISDRIANALQPADGSQDAEAARDAISRAFSDLMLTEPDVNLLALAPEQIDRVVEGYVAYDLCHRIDLDVGKAVLDKAPTYAEGMKRLEDMMAYVHQEVARTFRGRAEQGQSFTRDNAASLTAAVLRDTFDVFEGYI
jgi:hypothetical protein